MAAVATLIGWLLASIATPIVVATLLFDVTTGQPRMIILPLASLLAVATVAALPATLRALRIAPATLLRHD